MKVAISGSSGFIGIHLTAFLKEKGLEIIPLHRNLFEQSDSSYLENALKGCNIVINLAGATINHRWTESYKKEMMDSRVITTCKLVETMNKMAEKPSCFISVSAVGIYPSSGSFTEQQVAYGDTFLAQVCKCAEKEARKASPDIRLIIPRFGVVLSNDGGAFPMMILPFKLFLGGKVASGKQHFSWIHIDDLLNALFFLLQNTSLEGVFNFTSPDILTNIEVCKAISAQLHRPNWLPLPSALFSVLYGEGKMIVTDGQQAYPRRLIESGYVFHFKTFTDALANLYPYK